MHFDLIIVGISIHEAKEFVAPWLLLIDRSSGGDNYPLDMLLLDS